MTEELKENQAVEKSNLWHESFYELIPIYRMEGLTYNEIAEKLNVSRASIFNWKQNNEKLIRLCEDADKKYKNGIISIAEYGIVKRANGFESTETKQTVEQIEVDGREVGLKDKMVIGKKVKQTVIKKNIAPDVEACKTILRQDKKNWSENPEDEEFEIVVEYEED